MGWRATGRYADIYAGSRSHAAKYGNAVICHAGFRHATAVVYRYAGHSSDAVRRAGLMIITLGEYRPRCR